MRREDRPGDRTVGNLADAVATATSPASSVAEGVRDTELSTPTPRSSQVAVPDFAVKEVMMVWGAWSRLFRRVDSLRLGAR